MNVDDFRRIALTLEGVEEKSHMGNPDFRVGGKIFATLAAAKRGYGNVKLTPEQQAEFVAELPEVFIPVGGGWGRSGMTHIKLSASNEDLLQGALRAAWQVRMEANRKPVRKAKAGGKNARRVGSRQTRG